MKQTAVEWLMEIDKSRAITIEEWQQAKEMEKEQMVDAWSDGWLNDYEYDEDVKNSAEQYYNETFKPTEK
jgi:hypothetical protein